MKNVMVVKNKKKRTEKSEKLRQEKYEVIYIGNTINGECECCGVVVNKCKAHEFFFVE